MQKIGIVDLKNETFQRWQERGHGVKRILGSLAKLSLLRKTLAMAMEMEMAVGTGRQGTETANMGQSKMGTWVRMGKARMGQSKMG